jgi:1,4-alpha-glucan branching enzyme
VIKSRAAKGKADVTFAVDPQVGAQTAAVCGDWNDWSADADVMHRDAGGGFSVTVSLDAGRAYRFRYLLDGHRWDNDWSADAYQPNGFGGDDSVVDLTALAQAVPAATKKTPAARKQATPKKAPAPKASSAKEAPKKASAAKDEKATPDQAAPPAKPARKKAK